MRFNRYLLTAVLILLIFSVYNAVMAADAGNKLKEGAEAPEVIYQRYLHAVADGDLKKIEHYVYSREWAYLWKKSPRKMLVMVRKIIPDNPVLNSKTESTEYQYKYTDLVYIGTSKVNKNHRIKGYVRMIIENGEWKVYMQKWK